LRLQFCAILSQLHRHKEALEQAQEGIKLSHLIIRDTISVCRYYSRKIDFQNHFGDLYNFDESMSEPSTKKKTDRKQSPGKSHEQSKSSYPFDDDLESDDKLSENSVGQYFTK